MKRKELIDVISNVLPGLAAKVVVEQSDTIIFKDGEIMTYNGEISVVVAAPAGLEKVEGAVPGKELIALLKSLAADDIDVTSTKKEIRVVGPGFKAGIARHDIVLERDMDVPEEWVKLPEDFLTAVSACMFSVSSDMTRPLLTCVHATQGRVESCDNHRVTIYPIEESLDFDVLIPGRYAQHLIQYDVEEIGVTKGWLHFRDAGGLMFSCRTYIEKYPSLESIIPEGGEEATIPKGVLAVLESADIFAETDHKLDDKVTLVFDKGSLTVKTQNDSGWFEGTYKIRYRGGPATSEINPHMLKEILNQSTQVRICENMLVFLAEKFTHAIALFSHQEA